MVVVKVDKGTEKEREREEECGIESLVERTGERAGQLSTALVARQCEQQQALSVLSVLSEHVIK